jgi:hypothetical protein
MTFPEAIGNSINLKPVRRLNLLFIDEDEAAWWRRREAARAMRRKY